MSESIEESMRRTIEAVYKRAERAEAEVARLKAKQAGKKKKGARWEFCCAPHWNYSQYDPPDAQRDRHKFTELLINGWEPFMTDTRPTGNSRKVNVWLRRKKK